MAIRISRLQERLLIICLFIFIGSSILISSFRTVCNCHEHRSDGSPRSDRSQSLSRDGGPPVQTAMDLVQTSEDSRSRKASLCRHCTVYDLTRPTNDTAKCVSINIRPTAQICIHSDADDQYVSRSLRINGIWEQGLVKIIHSILKGNTTLGLVDIGANLGLYSLIAAALGRKVFSVEPLLDNARHFHKAIQINNFQDNITLIQNAIADRREIVKFKTYKGNVGGTSMYEGRKACRSLDCPTARTILMDDMVPLVKAIGLKAAVMKLDIEGAEHLALANASAMFETVFFPYIFMEIEIQKRICNQRGPKTKDRVLVDQMFRFFAKNRYSRVYAPESKSRLDPLKCSASWPRDVVWVHDSQTYPPR